MRIRCLIFALLFILSSFIFFNDTVDAAPPTVPHITINVYNESNASQNLTFNVFISNSSGSETYYQTGCTNSYYINLSDSPMGTKTSFIISSTGYYSRTFYMDINAGTNYTLEAYLPPSTNNQSHLYFLNIINEYGDTLEDVLFIIKKYINETSSYENMTVLYTDGVGQISAYLIPNDNYKIYLTKNNYQSKTDDYIPDPTYYGIYYPKYFKMYGLNYTQIPTYNNRTITFDVTMLSNNSLFIEYNSSINGSCTIEIYIYEHLNYTTSLNGSYTAFTDCNDSFYHSPINTSRMYSVYFYENFTDSLNGNFFYVRVVTLYGNYSYNKSYIEKKATDVYGSWELGYVNTFLIFGPFVLIICIVGYIDKGLGAISGGLYLAYANSQIQGLGLINLYEIAAFCVAIGFLLLLVYWRRGKT